MKQWLSVDPDDCQEDETMVEPDPITTS